MKVRGMTIKEVAEELDVTQQYVRIALQRGIFTFGTAMKMPRK